MTGNPRPHYVAALLVAFLHSTFIAELRAADIGTAFTYQGSLEDGSGPVTDTCDFRFGLWDAAAGGNQQGTSPQTVSAVNVTDGVFTAAMDFGSGAIDGSARWLAIEVQCSGDVAFTLLVPRVELKPTPHAMALPGLYTQQNATSPNLIGGHPDNGVTTGVFGATISGGGQLDPNHNRVTDYFGTVGGGHTNQAGDGDLSAGNQPGATVAGGRFNTASSADSTVGGGISNLASGDTSTIAGGTSNSATGYRSTVGGGDRNTSSGPFSTIAGGFFNTASMGYSTTGGGNNNTASGIYATVGGGLVNTANGAYSTVCGGYSDAATGDRSTVGGGELNIANGDYSTIGGGRSNAASAAYSTIAGGGPSDPSSPATILATHNLVTDEYGTVGGGGNNQAGDGAGTTSDKIFATVGGGISNTASGGYSTIGGGVGNTASAERCTISGGDLNQASGLYSSVGGGGVNSAGGRSSIVPGGELNNAGGDYSFAAGRRAKANHSGAFVWGDSFDGDVTSSANNQFTARTSGGARFYSNTALTAGVNLAEGGGSWTSISDKNVKENFAEIDKEALLERLSDIPVTTWNYKSQDDSIRHIGPMGQDFAAAFGVGDEPPRINTIDADGVALAAIQGLYEIVQEKDCEIGELREQNDRRIDELRDQKDRQIDQLGSEISNLKSEIAELKELVNALAARDQNGDPDFIGRAGTNGGGR